MATLPAPPLAALVAPLRPALVIVAATTLVLGVAVPLGFVGAAGLLAPVQAGGSLIVADGHVVGSALIGQDFETPRYFHSRPSATTAPDPKDSSKTVAAPDNADNSGASNLGPSSAALVARVRGDLGTLRSAGRVAPDAVTTSASGLDPDISPANARAQAARIAAARGLPVQAVTGLVDRAIEGPSLGVFGAPHVNVLRLNLALDAMPH